MYSLSTFDGGKDIYTRFYSNELQKVSGMPLDIIQTLKKETTPQGDVRHYVKLNLDGDTVFAWIRNPDLPRIE